MKALTIDRVGHCEFRKVPNPEFASNEILLDVQHVGLCGSDLNTFSGANPLVELPRIPGHEIGGIIVDAGADVSKEFSVGKSVIVIPYTTCGACSSCRGGRFNACQYNQTLGVQQDGGLCSQIAVREDRLILNDSLPATHLVLVEPLSVGFHAVDRGRIRKQETVVVLGGGMIGVGVILAAVARGARVLVVEVSNAKRQLLLELGVDVVINPTTTDVYAALSKLTNGDGADVVIEAVGLPETFTLAVDLVCYSGRVVYVGYVKAEVSYNTSLFNLKELDIMGSRNATRKDFEAVIEYITGKEEVIVSLISKIFTWDEAVQAFDYWQNNRSEIFKIVIDLSEKSHG